MSGGTYGGEDVNALVIDFGSYSCKVGYGGDFEPKIIIPSVVGKLIEPATTTGPPSNDSLNSSDRNNNLVNINNKDKDDMETDQLASSGGQASPIVAEKLQPTQPLAEKSAKTRYLIGDQLNRPRNDMEIITTVNQGGVIQDFNGYKAIIYYAYKMLSLNPKNHPLIISEPVWNDQTKRTKLADFFFKELQVPALQILKAPILALFSQAKSTGLVVDVGHVGVSITPIVEGQILQTGILRNLFACEFLRNQCRDWLSQKEAFPSDSHAHFYPVILPYQIDEKKEVSDAKPPIFSIKAETSASKISPSWRRYQEDLFYEDFCKQVVQVSDKSLTQVEIMNMANRHFEFPNGYHLDINNQRIQIAELMFDPSPLSGTNNSMLGIHNLMIRSSKICDTEVRQQLLSNIHLIGGGACIAGLADRLNNEIALQVGHKYKLIQPITYSSGGLHRQPPTINNERKYATWIGGSIIASLGSFHNMWISKEEWKELGSESFDKKNWVG